MVTQQVSHRPIKYQSRLWSQRGTKVNGSHHGDNPLLRPTGIQIATKSYAALQAMAPTNIKTVHQTFLLHTESNLDRLGMLSPTHDQRSQQKNGKITLQPVLINKSKFLKATHCSADHEQDWQPYPVDPYSAICDDHTYIHTYPPEGHQIGARKRRAPGNTILSQPYRHRVAIDGLNRQGSQLAASLEGEPGPTPAGKTLPHSYPETRFRRERARERIIVWLIVFFLN